MRIGLLQAIQSLLPTAEISVTIGGQASEDKVKWHNPSESPFTDEELLAEVDKLQAEHDSQEYARNRATAYASTGDQLDMQYWDSVNDTTTWKDHIASVKAQFPKV